MTIDSVWLGIAFLSGFIMRRIGLPPMLGFLLAGFVLHGIDMEHGQLLDGLADTGVMLLLFTIGLKLKIKSLADKVIWAGGLLSSVLSTLIFAAFLYLAMFSGLPFFNELSIVQIGIIALALSFSSTVFVIKLLEERGNLNTSEGKVAIGILIIQDIIAVIFLTISKEGWPSIFALLLLLTPLLRPLLLWVLRKTGHGEMLLLFGFFIAVLGGELFESVGLKSDLGALVFGMIIANDKKTNELANNLLHFKDFFLIAFFLNIGFIGLPNIHTVWISIVLGLLLVIKPIIYHFSFTRFKFPVRASYFSAISLTNYSEFGLIIGLIGTRMGWIGSEWLVVLALSISISFVISSLLNKHSINIFERYLKLICSFGEVKPYTCDLQSSVCEAKAFVFGMGQIGTVIYDQLIQQYPEKVIGLDSDEDVVQRHRNENRKVIVNDAADTEFWDNICKDHVNIVVLAMPNYESNSFTLKLITTTNSKVKIFATAIYDDEVSRLKNEGAHYVFNIHEEAGKGLVNDILSKKIEL